METLGAAPLAKAFREGSDDPLRALERTLAAADRGKDDKAILWRVPAASAKAEAAHHRFERGAPLARYDVLLGPAIGCFAPRIHPSARTSGELDTAKIARLAAVAFVANLTGHPSCVVPCVRDGLPMGVQIIGHHGDESRVLAAARAFEQKFGPRKPPRWHG